MITSTARGSAERREGAQSPSHHRHHIAKTTSASLSATQWYCEGRQGSYVRTRKSTGGILDMLELERPGGDMSHPPLSDLVLLETLQPIERVSCNSGGGFFDTTGTKGDFFLSPPNVDVSIVIEGSHRLRSLSFPVMHWESWLGEATNGSFSVDFLQLCRGPFRSPILTSALRSLWLRCEEEGLPSQLLVRAAGLEVFAELCRLRGQPLAPPKGGLAPWALRRCIELMRARLAEDISLDDLAAEAKLSPFHFARMFKQSVGVPPRVYLTQLRVEKARELLQQSELSITEIAQEVGYSSSQVLARLFIKHQRRSPSDYRRVVRNLAPSCAGQGLGRLPS